MRFGRRNLEISHAKKEMFPQEGHTKKDVVGYYHTIGKVLLKHIHKRALTLERYPNGITGKRLVQQQADESFDAAVLVHRHPDLLTAEHR